MARRGAFQETTIQVDGDDVTVKYRRHNAMDSLLIGWDQLSALRDQIRIGNEIDELNAVAKPTAVQTERIRAATKELKALWEGAVRFQREHITSVVGLVHDNEDGGSTPYDACDEDQQLWLLYDCRKEFAPLDELILNRQPRKGDPTPGEHIEPGSSTPSAESPE